MFTNQIPGEALPAAEKAEKAEMAGKTDKDKKEDKKKRKKDRVRSAWISFTGRIVAQIVGAIATVALGLLVLHKHTTTDARPAPAAVPAEAAWRAPVSPRGTAGEISRGSRNGIARRSASRVARCASTTAGSSRALGPPSTGRTSRRAGTRRTASASSARPSARAPHNACPPDRQGRSPRSRVAAGTRP